MKVAAEVIKDYPMDTNTYGKSKLALIEKISNRKLAATQYHEEFRRTDANSDAIIVDEYRVKPAKKDEVLLGMEELE